MQGQWSKRFYVFSGLALLVIIALAFGYWLNTGGERSGTIVYTSSNNVNAVLTKENQAFAQAEAVLKAGGNVSGPQLSQAVEDALRLYKQALPAAKDVIQEGQIKYKIARAEEKGGDYKVAIADFKVVIANPAYPRMIRAYAAMYLGEMYYSYPDAVMIQEETFKDPPYDAMVASSTALTYRHLFEYASSFHPLALSEARIANWYANNLFNIYLASSSPSQTLVADRMNHINTNMANIDSDVERAMRDPNAKYDVPAALQRKAIALGMLALTKHASPDDVEKTFQASVAVGNEVGISYLYTLIHYAIFLDQYYGEARLADIQRLLSSIYDRNLPIESPIVQYLKGEQNNLLHVKAAIVSLASADPKFKTYLETLGWTEADFK